MDMLKEKWGGMLQRNPEHMDYMPPEILKLFKQGEIEEIVLQDFASFPVSTVHGKLDKLARDIAESLGTADRESRLSEEVIKRNLFNLIAKKIRFQVTVRNFKEKINDLKIKLRSPIEYHFTRRDEGFKNYTLALGIENETFSDYVDWMIMKEENANAPAYAP